jgi:hypothetical protein
MARKAQPEDFHEPWLTARSKTWESAYRHGPPKIGDTPAEIQQATLDWEAARARAESNAEWIIYGSRLAEPAICINHDGSVVATSDRRILAFSRVGGLPDSAPSHEDFAKRVVSCVNALAGIADPERFIAEARALLKDLLNNETDRGDRRVLSLFARCVPPEELSHHDNDDDL